MSNLPSPPVPQKLREMLKDYPEHLARLQEVLDKYVHKPFHLMLFDGAVWAIEGRLETFMSEARVELKAAEAKGDAEAIQKAKAKDFAMGSARLNMGGMSDLFDYFQTHKEAFE